MSVAEPASFRVFQWLASILKLRGGSSSSLPRAVSPTRTHFIVGDFFAEHAARDMLHQFGVQVAPLFVSLR